MTSVEPVQGGLPPRGLDAGLGAGLAAPLAGLVTRGPLFVEPAATVAEVALAMREGRHSCAVVRTDPPGIVTNGDLQARVLAERRSPDLPVDRVMTRPVHVLPSGAPLVRAMLLMIDEGIEHVPVVHGERIIGVVTDSDVVRRQSASPLFVAGRIRRLDDDGGDRPAALAAYPREVAEAAAALLADGVDPLRIAAVVAGLNDALTERLLHLAERELGPPPCPYAWLALGSQGRMEQLLHSDQDTALAYAEPTPEAEAYFPRLVERVTERLVTAGLPRCPGGFTATAWCLPLGRWRTTLQDWIDEPDARALLDAQVFLDLRPVAGELDVSALDRILVRAGDRAGVPAALARAARRFGPRLGPLGRIRTGRDGRVDLKLGGTVPVVLLGRLYGLTAGSTARSTRERLRAAAADGQLSSDAADALLDAYRVLLGIRLTTQLADGGDGTGAVLAGLTSRQRRDLRGALHAVRTRQRASELSHPGPP